MITKVFRNEPFTVNTCQTLWRKRSHRLPTPRWSCLPDRPPPPSSCPPRSNWRSVSTGCSERRVPWRRAPGQREASSYSSMWADAEWCLPNAGRQTSPSHGYQCSSSLLEVSEFSELKIQLHYLPAGVLFSLGRQNKFSILNNTFKQKISLIL